MKRLTLLVIALALLGLILSSCGGASSSSTGRGTLSLTIKWPPPTRLIPTSAQSIAVYVSAAGVAIGQPTIISRPTGGATSSTVTIDALPIGSLTLSANAFPTTGGHGVSQAFGQVPITITATGTATVSLSLSSTVAQLAINPASPAVVMGTPMTVSLTAYSAVGEVVLLSSASGDETISWQSGNQSVFTATSPGLSTQLSGVAVGIATLTATMKTRDDGTTVSGTATVTVSNSGSGGGGEGGLQAGSPWPMFQRTTRHSALGISTAATGSIQWTSNAIGGGPTYGTVDKNGTIYVGPAALSPSGTILWTAAVPGGTVNSPAIGADGTLYYMSQTALCAVNPLDGSLIWQVSMPTADFGDPPVIGSDGTLYVDAQDGTLRAYTPNGSLKWSKPGSNEEAAPAIGPDGTIFAGSVALTAYTTTGTVKWAFQAGSVSFGTPTIAADGTVYACDTAGILHAISSVGAELWHYSTGFNALGTPPVVAADGTIYEAIGTGASGALLAFSPTGSLKWFQPVAISSQRQCLVVGSDGSIFVSGGFATGNQTTFAFSSGGALEWQSNTGGNGGGCRVLCLDGSGTLYVSASKQDGISGAYYNVVFALR